MPRRPGPLPALVFLAAATAGAGLVWAVHVVESQRDRTDFEASADLAVDRVVSRIEKHVEYTDSARGRDILDRWATERSRFVKVMPTDYKRALAELRKLAEQEQAEARTQEKVHG